MRLFTIYLQIVFVGLLLFAGYSCMEQPRETYEGESTSEKAASSLEDVANLTLLVEVASRGFDRWRCNDDGTVTCQWTAPTTGSVSVEYQLVVVWFHTVPATDLEPGSLQSVRLPIPCYGDSAIARVAGVDAEGRVGPSCPESEPFVPAVDTQ